MSTSASNSAEATPPTSELLHRIAELERQLAAQREGSTPATASAHQDAILDPDVNTMSKKERKKAQKRARKAASFLEKTELHVSKYCGRVDKKDQLIVPSYVVNGGADIKWEADPCDIDLKGILTPDEYFAEITKLNEAVAHARGKPIDTLLAISAGFLLLPIIPWAIRHRKHRTKHKKILVQQMREFNTKYALRGVRMRWRRKPDSQLLLERFPVESIPALAASAASAAPAAPAAVPTAEVVNGSAERVPASAAVAEADENTSTAQ